MKKAFRIILTLCIMLTLAFALTACDKQGATPTAQPTPVPTVTIPEGYIMYDNGSISFVYPQNWSKTDASVTMLINPTGVGNNITVAYEAKSDIYKTMTVDSFNTTLKPSMDAVGMNVTGVSVEQKTNALGNSIPTISYTASMSGVSIKQTLFVIDSGDKNYIVTVTETNADRQLVDNVFNTLNRK